MSTPPLPPIPDNIENLIGPVLLGTLFNFALFGVLSVQAYIYHLAFPYDNPKIRALVLGVVVWETAQTIMNGVDCFNAFARGFGNLLIAADPGISPIYTPVMGSVVAFVVQIFFCYRIYIIRNSAWWLSILIALISLMQAVCGFTGGVRTMTFVDNIVEAHARGQNTLVYVWLVGDAVADVAIALVMSYFLLTSKQSRATYTVIAKIVTLTIETNIASATIAIISLILFAGLPDQTYFTCPTLFLGKIYANTLLMTFNNRATVGSQMKSAPTNQHSTMGNYPTWQSHDGSTPFHAGLNPDLADTDTFTSGTLDGTSMRIKHHKHQNPRSSYAGSVSGTAEEYGMASMKV